MVGESLRRTRVFSKGKGIARGPHFCKGSDKRKKNKAEEKGVMGEGHRERQKRL